MKISLLPQEIYKATGKISVPIDKSYLKHFKIRIFYSFGKKWVFDPILNRTKAVSIIGGVTLFVDNQIQTFNHEIKLNSPGKYNSLSDDMVRFLIHKMVKRYLKDHNLSHIDGNILIQRIGKYEFEETSAALDAINELRNEGIIPDEIDWALVEYIKNTPVRLFSHEHLMAPYRGSLFIVNDERAFLTTTGYPDISSSNQSKKKDPKNLKVGIARSIEVRLVASSNTQREFFLNVLKDLYYRSFLWEATFQKSRMPAEANMVSEMIDLMRQGVVKLPKYIC